jgi:sugar lactone lactonase YvrE
MTMAKSVAAGPREGAPTMTTRLRPAVHLALAAAIAFGIAGCGNDSNPQDPGPRDPYSLIATFVGTGVAGLGSDGRPATQTALYWPQDLTFGPDGRPYILDWNNHRVRVIDADGNVRTLIGTGELGDAPEGQANEIKLNHPTHVAFSPDGHLILSAWHNSKVMSMDLATGHIVPICGDGQRAFGGDEGPADLALLDLPVATAYDPMGRLFIADQANQRVRMVDVNGIITTYAGSGTPRQQAYGGDYGPANQARLSLPFGQQGDPAGRIETDAAGNLYIADTGNNVIRKVDTNGIITTVAGTPMTAGFAGDGGPATAALLFAPVDIAFDADGNMYIADTRNQCVRKVDTSGIITTFAGRGQVAGFAGDGGHPKDALLDRPYGVAVDAQGNVYIADTKNNRIRVVFR